MVNNALLSDPLVAIAETEYLLRRKMREEADAALLNYQRLPSGPWETWVIMAGRGSGKTFAGVNAVVEHLRDLGPDAWVIIIAPTKDDARSVILEGPSGLWTLFKSEFTNYNKTLFRLDHIGGGQVKVYSGDEPDRLRGPQSTLLWIDEIAIIAEETVDNARLGNRLGPAPKFIATTTPRRRGFLKEILAEEGTVLSRATTDDNPYLVESVRKRLYKKYGGTRLGRQELNGELIEDIEGALWESSWIDDNRVEAGGDIPEFTRVVVAVDPAVSARKSSDETGIAVAALGQDGEYYVLGVEGLRASPKRWAARAIDRYDQNEADKIIGEVNNGGDLVRRNIEIEWRDQGRGDDPPFSEVRASRGKQVRAEPIALLYEQGRVHHIGVIPGVEDQLCTFPVENDLDDQLDALVYALTELNDNPDGDSLLMASL